MQPAAAGESGRALHTGRDVSRRYQPSACGQLQRSRERADHVTETIADCRPNKRPRPSTFRGPDSWSLRQSRRASRYAWRQNRKWSFGRVDLHTARMLPCKHSFNYEGGALQSLRRMHANLHRGNAAPDSVKSDFSCASSAPRNARLPMASDRSGPLSVTQNMLHTQIPGVPPR